MRALQLDLKVTKSKLCCSKCRTDFQSLEPCIKLKLLYHFNKAFQIWLAWLLLIAASRSAPDLSHRGDGVL